MIGQSEFLHLLTRINVYIKKEVAIKLFHEVPNSHDSASPRNKNREITFTQCIDLLRKIKQDHFHGNQTRDSIFDLVFGSDKQEVSAQEFLHFLHCTQKETNATLDSVKHIFAELINMEILRAHHEDKEHVSNCDTIDRLLFEEYLMSSQNDAYDPKMREFDSSTLNEPLSHYWINTSHNTYLVRSIQGLQVNWYCVGLLIFSQFRQEIS